MLIRMIVVMDNLGLQDDKYRMDFGGNLFRRKDHTTLLRAIEGIADRRLDWRPRMIGQALAHGGARA
jgi:hypothetical protein